jgi:cell division protein FtsX
MWPNLVRTSTCDVSGPLIYGRTGSLEDLEGKQIQGSIVVLEFNSGPKWKFAAGLGAKAIIFLEPNFPNRAEAESKLSSVPLSIPRFYLPLTNAPAVLSAASRGQSATLKCRQDWIRAKSEILEATFSGSNAKLSTEPITLFASSDAMSTVPGLAPGAEEIGGIAAALESARLFNARPHARPLKIVIAGGHGLALHGAREYTRRLVDEPAKSPFLTLSLDLSSGSQTIGSYARGWFYEYRDELIDPMRDLSRVYRAHTERLAAEKRISPPRLLLIDATNNGDNRTWKNNISGKFALDCEPMVLAGLNALTFRTVEDSRDLADTPFNTLDRIDFGNITRQVQTLACMLFHTLNDPADKGEVSDHKVPLSKARATSMRLIGGFARLTGQVVSFDPTRSFVPDTPVKDTIAIRQARQNTMMGVRGDMLQFTSPEQATYEIRGVPTTNSYPPLDPPLTRITAFKLDPTTGNIDYAASLGADGDFRFPIVFRMKSSDRTSPIVVFPCVAVDFYGLVDPQELRALTFLTPLDARSGSYPQDFGLFVPPFDARLNVEIEDAQVVFMSKGQRYIMLGGIDERRLILSNSSLGDEAGKGFFAPGGDPEKFTASPDGKSLFPNPSLQSAKDIIAINQTRLDRFFKYRIISPGTVDLQKLARSEVEQAESASQERRWSEMVRHSRAAWGYALRIHPTIMSTANDVVNGVVFYLFLLIPFSYFVERLFFGNQLLIKQLGTSVVIFVGAFILLRLIHPAFEIVQNPTMIFVAFVMGVLSLIVISFVLGKFQNSMQSIRSSQGGVHDVDIKRSSVAMAAFNLGVSNMRRRKARTILTTLTLVVMTFIVLSFTSIVAEIALNETPGPNSAAYGGILVRTPGLDALQNNTYRTIANEFNGRGTVVRRAFYYGADIGDTGVLSLQRADRLAEVRAMMGVEPMETEVLRPQTALLPGGRWFRPGDRNVVILPKPLADQLRITRAEVGKATVNYAGKPFTVIGIIDGGQLREFTDLDGDGILPPDFSLSRRYQEATASSNQAFRSYLRLDPSAVFLVPVETALALGADLRTVAVKLNDPKSTRDALKELMPRLRLNLYASVPKVDNEAELEVRQFSVFSASKSTGVGLIIVQLLIASIFVLNTMIASVYERTKEIAIFSSIGLAPNHIAMLFFAESLVYGVLGAVSGYYVAQATAKVIVATGSLPGLTLNFSSTSAVLSAVIVMAVVLLSTIFPARKAAEIAAPAMNDAVFDTDPEGDDWLLPLPFSISAVEAAPVTVFLTEWLRAYEGFTIGDFVSRDTRSGIVAGSGPQKAYEIQCSMWLAPYDLGISQDLTLILKPSQVPGVYLLDLRLHRLAGDPENWPTVNKRFLTNLRKQFLTWRTLSADVKQRYSDEVSNLRVLQAVISG